MSSSKILHGFVSGRVQGVFFRAETQKMARKLELSGWVKNTADGQVEVLVCGHQDTVSKMVEWLQSGPAMARVESVQLEPVSGPAPMGFSIIR